MHVRAGTRLGAYEVLSPVGAGGMGEVWQAKDTRLDRLVAIKVLPSRSSSNPQLLIRFEREARAISSLNHPHICTLHDVGVEEGQRYLVMEMIDGESLEDRLLKGAVPTEQVLRYGAQIAGALDAAHRRGIVHRDLKPGNIMLTRSGVKLVDFGLAKTLQDEAPAAGSADTETRPLTEEGTIVGTLQYMAPEQLEGLPIDHRADIFALGAVLYEMATGRRAFHGKTKTSLIAAIMTTEPTAIAELQPLFPRELARVVGLCLRKDPEERWQSAHDVRLQLESMDPLSSPVHLASSRRRIATVAAIALAAAIAGFGAAKLLSGGPQNPTTHLNIAPPGDLPIRDLALSPDGKALAFTTAAAPDGRGPLWIRDLTTGTVRAVEGTAAAYQPFWSPDGRFIAFMRGSRLQRVNVRGGAVETICAVAVPRGGTWNRRGTIVFAQDDGGNLYQVAANGGKPHRLPRHGNQGLYWPSFLPDDEHLLVATDGGSAAPWSIAVASLASKEPPRPITSGWTNAMYLDSGYLLFVKGRILLAQRFDPRTFRTAGEPVTVGHNIDDNDFGLHVFSAASNGTVAYRSRDVRSRLYLRDRTARELARFGEPLDWVGFVISPDGTKALAQQVDEQRTNASLWLIDLITGSVVRTGSGEGSEVLGTWAPDSQRFAFVSNRDGPYRMYEGSIDSTSIRVLSEEHCYPQSWVGEWIGCETGTDATSSDAVLVSASTGKRMDIAVTRAWENQARLSPDGKWVAYSAHEAGVGGVYVQPLPPTGRRWQLTSELGSPMWSRDGKTIYLGTLDKILSVAVQTDGSMFRAAPPQPVMIMPKLKFFKNIMPWGVIGNGETFLFNEPETNSASVHVIVNWKPE